MASRRTRTKTTPLRSKRRYNYSQFVDSEDEFDNLPQVVDAAEDGPRFEISLPRQVTPVPAPAPASAASAPGPAGLKAQLDAEEQSIANLAATLAHIPSNVLWYALQNRKPADLADAGIHKTPKGQLIPLSLHQTRSQASRRAYGKGVRCRKADCSTFASCDDPTSVIDSACTEASLERKRLKSQNLTKDQIKEAMDQFMIQNAAVFAQDKAEALARND